MQTGNVKSEIYKRVPGKGCEEHCWVAWWEDLEMGQSESSF